MEKTINLMGFARGDLVTVHAALLGVNPPYGKTATKAYVANQLATGIANGVWSYAEVADLLEGAQATYWDAADEPVNISDEPVAAEASDDAEQLVDLLRRISAGKTLDEKMVVDLINRRVSPEAIKKQITQEIKRASVPRTVEVKAEEAKPVNVGLAHCQFETLIKIVSKIGATGLRQNVWIWGPPGTGKTTAAKQVAKGLGLPFYYYGPVDNKYAFTGFRDASGNVVRTQFMDAFENGGVLLLDECDASLPQALLTLQGATANGFAETAAGTIYRHRDCIIICTANSAGHGADVGFARFTPDRAFMTRFVSMVWEIDEALEDAFTENKDWLAKVRRFREKARQHGLKGLFISPRVTLQGQDLLASGISEDLVIDMVVRKGMGDDAWQKISR